MITLKSLSKVFNIKGTILPFTEDNPVLVAHTKDGNIIEGESNITKAGKEIDYIEYKNEVFELITNYLINKFCAINN